MSPTLPVCLQWPFDVNESFRPFPPVLSLQYIPQPRWPRNLAAPFQLVVQEQRFEGCSAFPRHELSHLIKNETNRSTASATKRKSNEYHQNAKSKLLPKPMRASIGSGLGDNLELFQTSKYPWERL
jgi:hypothetical protein